MYKTKSWKNHFTNDVLVKVKYSKKEYERYKKTKKVIFLQQACGKLFSAVENYLMVKYSQRKRSYHSLWEMINRNEKDKTLLQLSKQLHVFYYNGTLDTKVYEAEGIYDNVYQKMKKWM